MSLLSRRDCFRHCIRAHHFNFSLLAAPYQGFSTTAYEDWSLRVALTKIRLVFHNWCGCSSLCCRACPHDCKHTVGSGSAEDLDHWSIYVLAFISPAMLDLTCVALPLHHRPVTAANSPAQQTRCPGSCTCTCGNSTPRNTGTAHCTTTITSITKPESSAFRFLFCFNGVGWVGGNSKSCKWFTNFLRFIIVTINIRLLHNLV